MNDEELRCDDCARESWPDGSLVLVVHDEPTVKTVRHVRVVCGPACAKPDPDVGAGVSQSFGKIADVFDYADQVIPAHDWERGTVQRFSRVLAAVHKRRGV